jgi:peptide/nickel transport system permease protein
MKAFWRFFSRWQNLAGVVIVATFLFIALAAPLLAPPPEAENFSPYRVIEGIKGSMPLPPGQIAIFGTVPQSVFRHYDIFYTAVWGGRSALFFGLVVALATASIGILIGAASAYLGGAVNNVTMRITDAFLAFPIIVGVVLFQQLIQNTLTYRSDVYITGGQVGPLNPLFLFLARIDPLMLALILFSWMPYARITNGIVLSIKQTGYVQAARALGAGSRWIILRHLIPNSISPSIVLAARDIGGVVLLQATFTFIGISSQSPWGNLLSIGRRWIIGMGGNPFTYWWVFLPITLALVFFGVGWNLLGDGLNDLLNPRTT